MGKFKIGDIVARKSYDLDVLFKVVDIWDNGKGKIVMLKGVIYRIQADAPESDLLLQTHRRINEHKAIIDKAVEKKYLT